MSTVLSGQQFFFLKKGISLPSGYRYRFMQMSAIVSRKHMLHKDIIYQQYTATTSYRA